MKTFSLVSSLLGFGLLCVPSFGINLAITEAMSSSGTGGTADWFEITNFDSAILDLSGFKMDDNSFSASSAVALNGVASLEPGESAVFLETSNPLTDIPAFRAFWGPNAASIKIGSYSGSGVGLSSSGDGVAIFDASNTNVAQVSFGAATTGVSFGYNTITSTFGQLSVDGQFGAYSSVGSPTNIGSPGLIPEPSTYASLLGALVLAWGLIRRR